MSRKQTRVSAKVDLSTVDGILDALYAGKIGREQAAIAHAALAKTPVADVVLASEVTDNGTVLVTFGLPDPRNGLFHGKCPQAKKGLRFWRAVADNMKAILAECEKAEKAATLAKAAK